MKIPGRIYTVLAVIGLTAMVGMLVWNVEKIQAEDYDKVRVHQVQMAGQAFGSELEQVRMVDGILIADYFTVSDSGFIYWGGLRNAPWEVGEFYPGKMVDWEPWTENTDDQFFGQGWGPKNYYINVDQGDETAVRQFLKTMDVIGDSEVDTLIVDFRFLRTMEFGAVLRLFNQIAPPFKMEMGTITGLYHDEKIISSGRPFFTTSFTVFAVDEQMPDPVKLLVRNIARLPDYEIYGDFGTVADSVCLMSTFEIGDQLYRLCSRKWSSPTGKSDESQSGNTSTFAKRIQKLKTMDRIWYKNRDPQAMKIMVASIVSQL